MVVPPQGVGGGAPIDAGDLEDSYIARFKALDPRVARLFGYVETLVDAGVLSVDDVAKYANDVLSASATVRFCNNVFSIGFSVLIFASAYMSASKAAAILNDVNIPVSKAVAILNDVNMPVSKVAAILSDVNMSASKAAAILSDVDIPVSKAVAILNDANMQVSKAAAILDNLANLAVSKAHSILADVNLPANRTQSILYSMVDQGFYDNLLNIITFNASDASYTANTTLSTGVNMYRNLNIASDVTLTLEAEPGVVIAYSITNSGTIASGWVKGAGGAGVCGSGNGGGGRGAVIILASNVSVGTVVSNSEDGAKATDSTCNAAGSPGSAGNFWLISGDYVPYGGDGGYYGGAGNPNGGGGGARGGAGGSANVLTFTDAQSLLNNLFKSVCDWWLVNVTNKTPSSTLSMPSLGGSGGGGGGAYNLGGMFYSGGGGGGGGGQIIIYGTSVTAGSVQAKGGSGGSHFGVITSYGGGGGGGIIYVFYKSLSGTFTYDVSGGTGANAGGEGIFRAIPV